MVRMILIVAAAALVIAGVATGLSRADATDPGQPITLHKSASPSGHHDVDGDGDDRDAEDHDKKTDHDKKADKQATSHDANDDGFAVTDSQPVVAHDHDDDGENDEDEDDGEDDWDDDAGYED